MGLLVKFIALDSEEEITDQAGYIQKIFQKIHANGLIKRLMVSFDELQYMSNPVKGVDEEGNIYVIEFNSMENGQSDNWVIVFR